MAAPQRPCKTNLSALWLAPPSVRAGVFFGLVLTSGHAFGQTLPSMNDSIASTESIPVVLPPPDRFVQYGVSITGEFAASSGPMCSGSDGPCVFGSGGGVAIRVGWRTPGPLYLGGAYELSVHDTKNLLRLGTLQQLRGEMRYCFFPALDTQPFVGASLGVVIYGNELAADTYGPTAGVSGGAEWEISRTLVARASLTYRLLHFRSFTDPSDTFRNGGFAQLIGFDLSIEARDRY